MSEENLCGQETLPFWWLGGVCPTARASAAASEGSERSGRLEAQVGQTSSFPLNMVVNVMLFKCFKNFFTEAHRFFIS